MTASRLCKPYHFLLAISLTVGLFCAQAALSRWASGGGGALALAGYGAALLLLIWAVAAVLAVSGLRVDWPLTLAGLALLGIGTIMGWRLTAGSQFHWKILVTRLAACGAFLGVVLYFGRRERMLGLLRRYYLIAALTMAAAVALSFFVKIGEHGVFFFRMVPWDCFKVLLVIAFAGYLSDHAEELAQTRWGLPRLRLYLWGPLLAMWCVPLAGMLLLRDFGQILIYGVLLMALLYQATGRLFYPLSMAAVTLGGGAAILGRAAFIPERIIYRFDLWRNPWSRELSGGSYQTVQALFAVDAGGLSGSGFGAGFPDIVPIVLNDFVYVALVEEGGAALGFAVLALYLIIVLRGFAVAAGSAHRFLRLLAAGFSMMLAIQALLNLGGVLNLLPMTGISLPLLSASGASLATNMSLLGFLVAIEHVSREETALRSGGSIHA